MISILSKAATWSPEQPFGEAFSRVFSSRLCSAPANLDSSGPVRADSSKLQRTCRSRWGQPYPEQMLCYVPTCRGEWYVPAQRMMHTALSNATLRRHGFVMPSEIAASK